jgi:hypothetical protein
LSDECEGLKRTNRRRTGEDFEGELLFIVHHAEANGARKPQLWDVDDSGDKLALKDRYRF